MLYFIQSNEGAFLKSAVISVRKGRHARVVKRSLRMIFWGSQFAIPKFRKSFPREIGRGARIREINREMVQRTWLRIQKREKLLLTGNDAKGVISVSASVPTTESKSMRRSIKRVTLRPGSRKPSTRARRAAPGVPSVPRSALM